MDNASLPRFFSYSAIWKAKVPPKVQVSVWIIAHGWVNTCDLVLRGKPFVSLSHYWCILCNGEADSVNCLYFVYALSDCFTHLEKGV